MPPICIDSLRAYAGEMIAVLVQRQVLKLQGLVTLQQSISDQSVVEY